MDHVITADFHELHEQASMCADNYFRRAIGTIDETFGEGYAKKNPALVAAFMSAASNQDTTSSVMAILQTLVDNLCCAIQYTR